MRWVIQFLIGHKNFSSLSLTVLISLWMLTANSAKQQQIARTLTLTVFFPFQFVVHQTTRAKNIFADNKKLKEEITTLNTKISILEQEAEENKRLRKLLGFERKFSYTLIPAHSVVREPIYLYRSIVINVGKKKGAALYMPVVNKDGVVGKIVQVMRNISLVQLLRDPSERTSVMVKRTSEVGILETINSKSFFVHYRKHADIYEGDTIVTSGLGGIYPKGLKIGIVTGIKESNEPLFKDVFLRPVVNFEHIEEVFVMKLKPQWAAFRSELDSINLR